MSGTFLPPREAAARLGVPLSTMQAMIRNGEVGAVRKGTTMMVSVEDIDGLLEQKQGRMAGDLAMPEVRALDEFRKNLVLALEDKVVKQALRQCIGGAGFRDQVLRALDDPAVKEKVAAIRKR